MRGIIAIFSTIFVFLFSGFRISASEKKLEILAATYPIYQITRNIAQGREAVSVTLLLPPQLGCPHNYALTPQDMMKLTKADILIINGKGLEEFLEKSFKKANPDIKVIDSSTGIKETLNYPCSGSHHDHDHSHDVNPHLFVSPVFSAKIAETISKSLSELDSEGVEAYKKNAENYKIRMEKLSANFAKLGKELKNNRIIQPHGVFDYLARDIGLKIVATLMEEGQEPSASEMMKLIKTIKRENVGAILTEPQYPDKIEKTLAKETKVPVIKIDPVASGPINAPLNYYDKTMQKNLKKLKETLGRK